MGLKLSGAGGDRFALGQNADINVTPFVDVMLVLLIIFMVAIPVSTTSIKLDLPEAGAPPADARARAPLVVSVQAGGGLFIGDAPVRISGLASAVAAELERRQETPAAARIRVRADKRVPYGDFVAVMDALQGAGFQHVALMAEQP